jgi:hypothetical protein
MQYEQLRPDYFVIDHMWQNGLPSPRDYAQAMEYTERKYIDGLVALDREKRQMKREKGTGRARKGEGTLAKALKHSETRASLTSSSGSKNAVWNVLDIVGDQKSNHVRRESISDSVLMSIFHLLYLFLMILAGVRRRL